VSEVSAGKNGESERSDDEIFFHEKCEATLSSLPTMRGVVDPSRRRSGSPRLVGKDDSFPSLFAPDPLPDVVHGDPEGGQAREDLQHQRKVRLQLRRDRGSRRCETIVHRFRFDDLSRIVG